MTLPPVIIGPEIVAELPAGQSVSGPGAERSGIRCSAIAGLGHTQATTAGVRVKALLGRPSRRSQGIHQGGNGPPGMLTATAHGSAGVLVGRMPGSDSFCRRVRDRRPGTC